MIARALVSTRIRNLIIIGIDGLPDKIDILPPLFIIGRELETLGQSWDRLIGKGYCFLRALIQRIRQKDILIRTVGVCFPVDDLSGIASDVHPVNTSVAGTGDCIAPQGHRGVGALLLSIILPFLFGSKGHGTRKALGDGSAVVAPRGVAAEIAGTIVIVGRVVGNRCLGNLAVFANGALHKDIVVFLIGIGIAGQALCRYAPGIIPVVLHGQRCINFFVSAVTGAAVQLQRQSLRALPLLVSAVQP